MPGVTSRVKAQQKGMGGKYGVQSLEALREPQVAQAPGEREREQWGEGAGFRDNGLYLPKGQV